MSDTITTLYHKQRKPFVQYTDDRGPHYWTTPARYAINIARDEMALRKAEADGLIRFAWEYDYDYEPDGDYDLEEERRKLASGEWEALFVAAYVRKTGQPHDCPSCQCEPVETEEHGASLGGIVVDVSDRFNYRREVERELASEAGVI